uniref:Uncharacterized protein n=1 Tax=Setaria italica TaxID=4555 RepID=K3YX14_SETIT
MFEKELSVPLKGWNAILRRNGVFQMCDVGKFRGHAYLPRINKVERSGEICFCTAGSSAMLVSLHHGRVAQLPSMFCSSAPGFIRAGVLQMSLSGGTSVME